MTKQNVAVVEGADADAIAVISDNDKFLAVIERLANSKEVDVSKMAAILDLKERLMAKEAEIAFNEAYARIMKLMPRVKKTGEVSYPVNKNDPDGPKKKAFNFAKWEDMDAAIRPILLAEGFDLSFDTETRDGGGCVVVGTLSHVLGHNRKARVPLPIDASGGKNNLQGMGSTISYGKRYATEMLLNIVREGDDDDGERGGMVFIDTPSQCHLNALIDEVKADRVRFLRFMGAVEVENIQVKDYPKAINALMEKKAVAQKVPA